MFVSKKLIHSFFFFLDVWVRLLDEWWNFGDEPKKEKEESIWDQWLWCREPHLRSLDVLQASGFCCLFQWSLIFGIYNSLISYNNTDGTACKEPDDTGTWCEDNKARADEQKTSKSVISTFVNSFGPCRTVEGRSDHSDGKVTQWIQRFESPLHHKQQP